MNKCIGITDLALHKLMANTVLKKYCCNYYLIGQWSFSPGTTYPCKIFLRSRTNHNSVFGMLVKAQCNAVRKWLLLLSNSWTKEYKIPSYSLAGLIQCYNMARSMKYPFLMKIPSSHEDLVWQNRDHVCAFVREFQLPLQIQLLFHGCSILWDSAHRIPSTNTRIYRKMWSLMGYVVDILHWESMEVYGTAHFG